MIVRGNNVLQTLTKGTATEYNAVCFQAKQRSPGMMFAFARRGFTQAILCEITFNITWKFQHYFLHQVHFLMQIYDVFGLICI